jgi:hypothetical protein
MRKQAIEFHLMRNSRAIRNPQTWLLIAYLAIILSLYIIDNVSKSLVYGHDFVPNESASFLSFANQLEAAVVT